MFDLETNKAIALRLVEVFNGRRLDLLEDVLHPEFRERGISAFPPEGPDVGPDARPFKAARMPVTKRTAYPAASLMSAYVAEIGRANADERTLMQNCAGLGLHLSPAENAVAAGIVPV